MNFMEATVSAFTRRREVRAEPVYHSMPSVRWLGAYPGQAPSSTLTSHIRMLRSWRLVPTTSLARLADVPPGSLKKRAECNSVSLGRPYDPHRLFAAGRGGRK